MSEQSEAPAAAAGRPGGRPGMTGLARLSLTHRALDHPDLGTARRIRPVRDPLAQAAAAALAVLPGSVHRGPVPGRLPADRRGAGHRADRGRRQGHAGVTESHLHLPRGRRPDPGRSSTTAPTSTTPSPSSSRPSAGQPRLPDGVDPQVIAGSTDDLPVMVLAVGDGGDPRGMPDKIERIMVPELQPHRRGARGHRHRRPRGDPRHHPRPRQAVPARHPRRPRSPTRCAPTAPRSRPAPSPRTTGPSRVQVGTRVDTIDQLKNLYLTPAPQAASPGHRPDRSPPRPPGAAAGAARQPKPVRLGDVATSSASRPSHHAHPHRRQAQPRRRRHHDARRQRGRRSRTPSSDKLPDLAARARRRRAVTVVFDQAPYVEKSIESLTTEGLLGLLFAVAGHPGLPAVGALHPGHRGVDPAVGGDRADRAVDRRPLAQHAHPRRAHHRHRPRRRRLDRGPGEHQAPPRLRRGETAGDHHRGARGRRRGHRLHPHHRRGVPADRARRRHGRRAVRPVRAHRHRRAARLPAGVADRRPGARLLVPASRPRSRRARPEAARRPRRRSCAARCSAPTCRCCASPPAAGSPPC